VLVIILPLEISGLLPDVEFKTTLSRGDFERITDDLCNQIVEPVIQLIAKSGVKQEDVFAIQLFGGAIRIPKVQSILSSKVKIPIGRHINSDEAAAFGSAHYGALLSGVSNILPVELEDLSFSKIPSSGISTLNEQQLLKSKELLDKLDNIEQNRKKSIQAKNELQSFINEVRENVESNNKMQENLLEILQAESSWLDDNFEYLPATEYEQRLEALKQEVEKEGYKKKKKQKDPEEKKKKEEKKEKKKEEKKKIKKKKKKNKPN